MIVTEERMSFRKQLEAWHDLVVRERQLQQTISRQEHRLAELQDRLSPSGILGAFRNTPMVNADIRPQGGHGDKVFMMIAETDEKMATLQLSMAFTRAQLQDVQDAIDIIEGELQTFSERHRRAAELMFRDRETWYVACEELRVEKSRLYELLQEIADGVDRWLMWRVE